MAGDVEGALNRLEQGLRERSPEIVYVAVDQAFDALREEERFRRLLDELGLEPPGAR